MKNNNSSLKKKNQWGSRLGFLLSVLGSTVGLGSIWRFPSYSYENSGGTFIFAYLVSITVIGIPILIFEFGLGNKYRKNPPNVFRQLNKNWAWVGWLSVLMSFSLFGLATYYTVIIAWCLVYFKHAFTLGWGSNTEEFFFQDVLGKSNSILDLGTSFQMEIVFSLVICWVIAWLILYRGLNNGLEKANKIFIPVLFVITLMMFLWGISLDGAWQGILAYIQPEYSEIFNAGIWFNAMSQALFSLSLVMGVMIIYSAFLKREEDLVKPSIISAYGTAFYAIFFGFIIFSILGYMSKKNNVPIDEVVKHGPGLAFITLTEGFNLIATDYSRSFAIFAAILFFFSLFLAGLSSLLALIETLISTCVDEFKWRYTKSLTVSCILGFIAGVILYTHQAGIYWVDAVDEYVTGYILFIAGTLHVILVGWFTPLDKLMVYVNENSSIKIGPLWKFSIKYITPVFFIGIGIKSILNHINEMEYSAPIYGILIFMLFSTIASSFVLEYFHAKKFKNKES